MEGNNKILQNIRTKLSRKTSQDDDLVDTLRRMWVGSDPNIIISSGCEPSLTAGTAKSKDISRDIAN